MSSFKTEIRQIQVKGKIQKIEVKSTVTGYVSKGLQGNSAYQVALKDGFIGTEEQWLDSLVGPQGEQGIQGIQGDKGDKGDKGDTGDTDRKSVV